MITRPAILIIFVLSALVCFTGCDRLYRQLHREGAEERKLIGEIVPFERNPAVEEIQKLLAVYGYNPGSADGVLGVQTRNAVERFQEGQGLMPTRFVDEATWQKLIVFRERGFIANGELNIKAVQTALQEAGFSPGKIDGRSGPSTKKAVEEFQKAKGLKVDGKIGYQTLTRLFEHLPQEVRE